MDKQTMTPKGAYEISINDVITPPEFTFYANGLGCSPVGDLIAIKAKPKNGKTFLSTIIASVILGGSFGRLRPAKKNARVAYFDTEQNKANTQRLMVRMYSLCGWDGMTPNDRLRVFNMREMKCDERLSFIESITYEYRPTAIFIDGIADLIYDFNDIEQSQKIIARLMKLSSTARTAIFFILHTNKNDSNMKGHLGSLALQKCADALDVEAMETVFHVSEAASRNEPIDDFYFCIDPDGMPLYVEEEVMYGKEEEDEEEKGKKIDMDKIETVTV